MANYNYNSLLDPAALDHLRREHGRHVLDVALFRRPDLSPRRPIPAAVQTRPARLSSRARTSNAVRAVWQSMGGMQQGSIWGHGGYVAPGLER